MLANSQFSYLPYDDYAQSANTLFHFMTKPEYLDSVLRRRAIIPRYCVETIDYLNIHTDSKPMYISFSAFKTKEEAEQEGDNILQHDEVYINALTSNAYINQFYSERK